MTTQDPGTATFERAWALHQQGEWQASLALLEVLITKESQHGMALAVAGVNALQLARPDVAASYLARAAALAPSNASIYYNLGVAYEAMAALESALQSYDTALALDSSLATAQMNRGNVLRRLFRFGDALATLDKAVTLQPGDGRVHYNRGVVLQDIGSHREALEAYTLALKTGFVTPEVFNNQGNAFLALHAFSQAVNSYAQALALHSDDPQALTNHAIALQELGDLDGALASYRKALTVQPECPFVRGAVLYLQSQTADWNAYDAQLDALVRQLKADAPASPPFSLLAQRDDPALHRVAAAQWVQAKCAPPPQASPKAALGVDHLLDAAPVQPKDSRVRVGYFSCDFYDHATLRLFIETLEAHDHERFEWFAFSWGPAKPDAMRERARLAVDHFVEVDALSDLQVAQLARQWELDIAVDLKGHTHGARPGIFVHRAAPVQIGFLGYPGTFGHTALDFILADRTVLPSDQQVHYAERICHLPGCYQPNGRYQGALKALPDRGLQRVSLGLPEHEVVFCCFNATYKITPEVFSVWMRVLHQVDGSVLWLLEGAAATSSHLRASANLHGIAPDRLIFARLLPHAEHLERYRCADLFLDTFPCGAHTTASDALREGLPVLTCNGQSFASRVAASLLEVLELPELVQSSLGDYEDSAVELAINRDLLALTAAKLRQKCSDSDLFCPDPFAKGLETTFLSLLTQKIQTSH